MKWNTTEQGLHQIKTFLFEWCLACKIKVISRWWPAVLTFLLSNHIKYKKMSKKHSTTSIFQFIVINNVQGPGHCNSKTMNKSQFSPTAPEARNKKFSLTHLRWVQNRKRESFSEQVIEISHEAGIDLLNFATKQMLLLRQWARQWASNECDVTRTAGGPLWKSHGNI